VLTVDYSIDLDQRSAKTLGARPYRGYTDMMALRDCGRWRCGHPEAYGACCSQV